MKDKNMQFIKSTDYMKNLIILSEIDKNPSTSQSMLASSAGISAAMANSYIKNLCDNGYVDMHGNNKRTVYQLTAAGMEHKRYLLVSFMAELIDITANVSEQIKQMLLPVVKDGEKSVFFYGAGETGLVCVKVAAQIPLLKILGFIDDNPELHQKKVAGFPVFSMETALQQPFDKVVISVFPDDNPRKKLVGLVEESKIVTLSDLDMKIWGK